MADKQMDELQNRPELVRKIQDFGGMLPLIQSTLLCLRDSLVSRDSLLSSHFLSVLCQYRTTRIGLYIHRYFTGCVIKEKDPNVHMRKCLH